MTHKKLGPPAPAALQRNGNDRLQGGGARGQRPLQPGKGVGTNHAREKNLSPVPSFGICPSGHRSISAKGRNAKKGTAPTNAVFVDEEDMTQAPDQPSQDSRRNCAAIPEKRSYAQTCASTGNVLQAQERSCRDGVACRSGDSMEELIVRRSAMATTNAVDTFDQTTSKTVIGFGRQADDQKGNNTKITKRKRKSVVSHGLERKRTRQAPKRLGAAETAACVAQCIPQHDDVNNATNEPEGESIYRNVCQLEEELEAKVKPFREGKQRKTKTLRTQLKNKSHYKEVQKMLRQPCMPKTTNELTATDVPWVDSPLKSDDERPMSANRHPELMSPADRHEDVMHSTSPDGSKGNVCEFPTNEKAHATVCECAETQDMVQLECLQQQLQGLIEENMLWKSRCADLEAKTAAQLRDTELNERMSCMYNGSVQSMEEAVNRFAKQLEVLLHDFKLLKESVQKLKA